MKAPKFDSTNQQKPLSWYRENGLKGLAFSVLAIVGAFVGAGLAKRYPDYATFYKVLAWPMALAGCLTLLVSGLLLFTWFTLRNDPDVTK